MKNYTNYVILEFYGAKVAAQNIGEQLRWTSIPVQLRTLQPKSTMLARIIKPKTLEISNL